MTGRIMLAGTNSGCGKTTATIGMLAALKKMQIPVLPIKVGPDYIDPMFHSFVTGQKGRNLDSFLIPPPMIQSLFQSYEPKGRVTVLEGVMGLYDGLGNTCRASSAEISKILNTPVILIVNAGGMSVSAGALVNGFVEFDKQVQVKGVIFNRVKSDSQYCILSDVIKRYTDVVPLGFISDRQELTIPSRHLGLLEARQVHDLSEKIKLLTDEMMNHVDMESVLRLAQSALPHPVAKPFIVPAGTPVTIGVAKDSAFSFYYEDNLELLEKLGAKLVYFSPLFDEKLPNVDGLYIGGGYPEQFLAQLEKNESMRRDIRTKIEEGLVVYAECGGLMYMTQTVSDVSEKSYQMVGALKGSCHMGDRLRHFGYVRLRLTENTIFGEAGDSCPAHEFHYSVENIQADTAIEVLKEGTRKKTITWKSGYIYKNLMASYPHIHFYGNIAFARHFLDSCRKGRN